MRDGTTVPSGLRAVDPTVAPAPRIRGVGIRTGWGSGLAALAAAEVRIGMSLVPVATPEIAGDRFRRATRECVLGATVVRDAVRSANVPETVLAGDRTGLLYVSATAYAAANRAFLEDEGSTTLHFPYTSPSAVSGEVTIEFGIRGPYVNLMGGGPAALHGLWCAARWLATDAADRVLVLAIETAHEVHDLFRRTRRLYDPPLVEGAACLLLEAGDGESARWASASAAGSPLLDDVDAVLDAVLEGARPVVLASGGRRLRWGRAEAKALAARGIEAPVLRTPRHGETFACAPLIALAEAAAAGRQGPCLVTAAWRDDYGAMLWPL